MEALGIGGEAGKPTTTVMVYVNKSKVEGDLFGRAY